MRNLDFRVQNAELHAGHRVLHSAFCVLPLLR